MQVYLNIVQIILSVVLVVLILFEVQSSGLGGVFGGTQSGMIRKRRGAELLIFRLTVGTSVLFFVVAMINVLLAS
ncbi:MAG: preprotein translocase subunit SecG [Chloroflexi bacterium]|nr:preprotein translocase subunit SecG [Chloroflexota bacterium]OQB02813.1 MAG: preprotein translocase subunit SecG [Chloroflexi bacterium ADurb.Bin222]HOC20428.1 preprotein translocase subunit SecG [Anaerolineae bacterium]HOS79589.1 preprotein translocase subunit SecG [Anaerolineae bacterium]HQE98684.1 preprotein translocase subunit SecG [Anaerolineae bacterium]